MPSQDRDRAIECHLAGILGYLGYLLLIGLLLTIGMLPKNLDFFIFALAPIISLLSSLFVCSKYDSKSKFITHHRQESLNFQISYTLYQLGCIVFIWMLCAPAPWSSYSQMMSDSVGKIGILLLLIPALIIVEISRFIWTIDAVSRTMKGEFHQYAYNLRLWK
jgi:uncharacterized Tic20 family protein